MLQGAQHERTNQACKTPISTSAANFWSQHVPASLSSTIGTNARPDFDAHRSSMLLSTRCHKLNAVGRDHNSRDGLIVELRTNIS
jgi:hypothetical protein